MSSVEFNYELYTLIRCWYLSDSRVFPPEMEFCDKCDSMMKKQDGVRYATAVSLIKEYLRFVLLFFNNSILLTYNQKLSVLADLI